MINEQSFGRVWKLTVFRVVHLNIFVLGWMFLNLGFWILCRKSGASFGFGTSIALLVPTIMCGAVLRERWWRARELRRGNDLGPMTVGSLLWGLALYTTIIGFALCIILTLQTPPSPTDTSEKAIFLLCAPSSFLVMSIVDDLIPGPRLFRWKSGDR